jgi:DnaK suppressor protein
MTTERKKIVYECARILKELKRNYHERLARFQNYGAIKDGQSDFIGLANVEVEKRNSMLESKRLTSLLQEIKAALHRIENGTYGVCQVTGEEIAPNRLLAVPWTRVSIHAIDDR